MIKVGSDFSGVGAFDEALKRLGISYENIFACDMDKYARITYLANNKTPGYYPEDVYDREIPTDSLDIYMSSPPCQSFSLAGNRLGEYDERGVLFYNTHKFIKKNKPRFFIIENVKGLLSDDNGRTFGRWLEYLGGKSINGNHMLFPCKNNVPYHIYWKVINARNHGVPQNRERVFVVGIRDDKDNKFTWANEKPLKIRLRDILESDVDPKYFLSKKMLDGFVLHSKKHSKKGNGFTFTPNDAKSITTKSITTKSGGRATDNYIKVRSNTKCGFEIAKSGDAISLAQKNSKTRRGRVGKQYSQTLTTQSNMGVYNGYYVRRLTPRECFRLMDFPDTFDISKVSDTQAYKQAGNSIVVQCLVDILKPIIKMI